MSIISRMRKQTACWWEQTAAIDDYGNTGFNAPIEISCRWVDKREEFIDPDGDKQLSKSIVYVDRDMKIGDYLILDSLSNIATPADPESNVGAFQIRGWENLPNFKATEFLKTAFL